MRRRSPRHLAVAVHGLRDRLAPASPLARLQLVWEQAVGETVAAEAHPVAEHEGVLTVACSSAVWAAELRMLSAELVERCNAALGGEAVIADLRCKVDSGGRAGPPRRGG